MKWVILVVQGGAREAMNGTLVGIKSFIENSAVLMLTPNIEAGSDVMHRL